MKIDMSPLAVSTRLKRASQLRELCLALAGPRLKRPWGVPEPGQHPTVVKEQSTPYQTTSGNIPDTTTNRKMK